MRIDGHGYSPTILHRILHMAAASSSFDQAEVSLKVVGELDISDRQINKLATEYGGQMAAARDAQTQAYVQQPLPRTPAAPATPIPLAAVFVDGGRMRTRQPGQGPGVHGPHWRETKNAALHRMTCEPSDVDPQPKLPDCFRNQAYVEKLVHGLKGQKTAGREETSEPEADPAPPPLQPLSWRPQTVFRTCLSSLAGSDQFGPMLAAAADARGFFQAERGVFVGDGQAYNWKIQQRWFPTYTAVADFIHPIEYLYESAKAIYADPAARWLQYVAWAEACWQGRVDEVRAEMTAWLEAQEPPPPEAKAPETDPRAVVASAITYLEHNRSRMDYPRYRREGLPVTSSLAESFVKQVNKRVKGTEMFWDDGRSGEAILQLRAAVLSDGAPLADFLATRPISLFSSRCRSTPQATSA